MKGSIIGENVEKGRGGEWWKWMVNEFSSSSSFILSNHIWHGIWGPLSDNTIEYKQGQRYRYTQLIQTFLNIVSRGELCYSLDNWLINCICN